MPMFGGRWAWLDAALLVQTALQQRNDRLDNGSMGVEGQDAYLSDDQHRVRGEQFSWSRVADAIQTALLKAVVCQLDSRPIATDCW